MRARFPARGQRAFLEEVQQATGAGVTHLSDTLGLCARTVRDWRRERWQMDEGSLNRRCELAKLHRPEGIVLLPEHWSVANASRIGGRRHIEWYGNPGTPAGRSLGGRNAQRRFRSDPEYF